MDLEGIARRLMQDGIDPEDELRKYISFYKGKVDEKFLKALVEEVRNSRKADYLSFSPVGLRAGEAGLGSRGTGDYDIHSAIIGASGSDPRNFDDAGSVEDLVVSVDGIHSRLSYFPYLAGFHATRAALRDVMVKGGRPLGVLVDIHLSDDSDVSMLFDFQAGVTTVTDFLGIRVVAGSTLRIGGDIVLGERISGGIGAIGKIRGKKLTRDRISAGQYVVMTEGNGGGTVTSMAIYYGRPEVVDATIDLSDLMACKVVGERLLGEVESMTDVTNGGIRGDALEVSNLTSTSMIIDPQRFRSLIDPKVLKLMEEVEVDVYGVSVDAILIFTNNPDVVIGELRKASIKADVVGRVEKYLGHPIYLEEGSTIKELKPNFRESPYTPVKKVVGNTTTFTAEVRSRLIRSAALNAAEKKERFTQLLNSRLAGDVKFKTS